MKLLVKIKKKLGSFVLDVDFETSYGIFAILGASGCGKSMTLKCIAGIETPDEGQIILGDCVLYDSEKKINLTPQKRKVGYMFQDYALFPNMTVEQNIMTGMGKRPDKDKAAEFIERFYLKGLEKYYPFQLSGGQKQRVAMARMMASEPDVILLDEPFSALDSYLKWELEQQMRELLDNIQKPVLFVSHNRDEVYRLCTYVSCINNGKMEVIEPKREFFQNPKTKTAAILSGCKNISKVELIDEHHIFASDWGVTFTCSNIPKGISYIGIRAHYLKRVEASDRPNCIPVNEYRLSEDVFEWNLSFKTKEGSSWLQWKKAKEENERDKIDIPKAFCVDEKDILFLCE